MKRTQYLQNAAVTIVNKCHVFIYVCMYVSIHIHEYVLQRTGASLDQALYCNDSHTLSFIIPMSILALQWQSSEIM